LTDIVQEYPILIEASKKITNNHELHLDLLHYALEELYSKKNYEEIINSGGVRFYVVRIMLTQWRSNTGPFYKMFFNQKSNEITDDIIEYKEYDQHELEYIKALEDLAWYDKELFKIFSDKQHTISSLSRETGIPRSSVDITIKKVRKILRKL
jgi:formylmethanofuran dehydrogenase subunit E-like metal-binding protein